MPPLKNPLTLYIASLNKIRTWIQRLATSFYKYYGDIDDPRCQDAVSQINQYFVSSVPAHIIDELFQSIDISDCLDPCDYYESMPIRLLRSFDARILITMYVNANTKTLNAQRFVNDAFWKSTLPSLKNLLHLDLNKVCTDEILEVVGKHCTNLEFINIVSKSSHTRTKDRHNALKLQLWVSDVGLDYLSNCKELRDIVMTCVIRKGCGGRQVTNEGLKRLLMSLPKLRKLNYTDTGILLDHITNDGKTLSLVSVTDYHPVAHRILKLQQLCPNLSELHLTYAFSSEDNRNDVMSVLASSSINVSTLSLTNFIFDQTVKECLEAKGIHLKVFNFFSSVFHSIEDLIRTLGYNCPNLESLDMNFHFSDSVHNNRGDSLNPYLDKSKKLFCNLQNLKISGVQWDVYFVLPLVLKQAVHVRKITLLHIHTNLGCLDETLKMIQLTNPFHHLESLCFLKSFKISLEFLKTFVISCPALRFLQIPSESKSYTNSVMEFSKELSRKNFDLNIEICSPNGW